MPSQPPAAVRGSATAAVARDRRTLPLRWPEPRAHLGPGHRLAERAGTELRPDVRRRLSSESLARDEPRRAVQSKEFVRLEPFDPDLPPSRTQRPQDPGPPRRSRRTGAGTTPLPTRLPPRIRRTANGPAPNRGAGNRVAWRPRARRGRGRGRPSPPPGRSRPGFHRPIGKSPRVRRSHQARAR